MNPTRQENPMPEGVTPDGARYAAHLIRKRSKGDRFHPRRPETATAMLAGAEWLDQFATGTPASHLPACGATASLVVGRCGRDEGHPGPHRSTGDTFEAWFEAGR